MTCRSSSAGKAIIEATGMWTRQYWRQSRACCWAWLQLIFWHSSVHTSCTCRISTNHCNIICAWAQLAAWIWQRYLDQYDQWGLAQYSETLDLGIHASDFAGLLCGCSSTKAFPLCACRQFLQHSILSRYFWHTWRWQWLRHGVSWQCSIRSQTEEKQLKNNRRMNSRQGLPCVQPTPIAQRKEKIHHCHTSNLGAALKCQKVSDYTHLLQNNFYMSTYIQHILVSLLVWTKLTHKPWSQLIYFLPL